VQGVTSANPQIFALGVKELWETKRPLDRVIHTMGGPCERCVRRLVHVSARTNLVALGLVVGLDSKDVNLDVHELLQRLKQHPRFRPYLEGGELVEWGAKTIPEAVLLAAESPFGRRRRAPGRFGRLRGRAVAQGIHYAMQSGCMRRA